MNLFQIIETIERAERLGTEKDEPEGRRYIQISDRLATAILDGLMEVAEDIVVLMTDRHVQTIRIGELEKRIALQELE